MIIFMMLIGAVIVYTVFQKYYRDNWSRNLDVDIHFKVQHAVAGDTVDFTEVITNRKRLPLPYIHLKFQVDKALEYDDGGDNSRVTDKVYRNDIFSLLMYQKVTRTVPVLCTKRGVFAIRDFEMVSQGIFMDEVLVVRRPVFTEIVVYPRAVDTSRLQVAFSRIMGNIEQNKRLYEDPFVFRGIRDYVPTDALNRINWKASAKTGELMVNQFNETICQEVCILLNVESEGMLRRDDLSEVSISIAAGLSQMLIENNVAVSVISNGIDYATKDYVVTESASGHGHIGTLNTALARIALEKQPVDYSWIIENDVRLADDYRSGINAYSKKSTTMYVMISQNKREDLQKAYNRLISGDSSCMWIVPAKKDDDTELVYSDATSIVWEVG